VGCRGNRMLLRFHLHFALYHPSAFYMASAPFQAVLRIAIYQKSI